MTETLPDVGRMRGEIHEFMTAKEALVASTMSIQVTDESSKIAASDFMTVTLVPLRKQIETKRKEYSTALRRLATSWDKEFTPALQSIDGLIGYLKQGILAYVQEQEEKARKLQEELNRKAEEDRKATEARGEAPQIPEQIADLAPAVDKTVRTSGGTSTIRKIPYLDIYDEAKLPRQYLIPDRIKITEDVKAGIDVPGARIGYRQEVSVRPR